MFTEVDLEIEDLLFLESFQIKYLKDRLPEDYLTVLLSANPAIAKFFKSKYPPIASFVDSLLSNNIPPADSFKVEYTCKEVLLEVAELIVYNKFPEHYDRKSPIKWELDDIIDSSFLKGKTVIDAGAGTGRIAFMVAELAKKVYAVEPVSSMRAFMIEKARKENIPNVYVMDGFLDAIPLPDNAADILITSNAIGWNLEEELSEIERVLKNGSQAIHLIYDIMGIRKNPLKGVLDLPRWNYKLINYKIESGLKYKYTKTVKQT
jgi:ubiquinone/menaquinone biosynthesis C-methylase UbiE